MKKTNEEEAKKTIKTIIEEHEQKDNLIQELTSNTDYIDWIEKYTEKCGGFSDQTRFKSKPIPQHEQNNIDKLLYFFEGISNYAEKNYIYPHNDNGIYYIIVYNNISYEIGVLIGQGIISFCTRSTKKENAINFNDIMRNKTLEKPEEIKNKLIELQDYLNTLINENIPIEALNETTQNVLKKVKK